jgi:hypothetical protein
MGGALRIDHETQIMRDARVQFVVLIGSSVDRCELFGLWQVD